MKTNLLRQIIREEIQNEIFGFGKKEKAEEIQNPAGAEDFAKKFKALLGKTKYGKDASVKAEDGNILFQFDYDPNYRQTLLFEFKNKNELPSQVTFKNVVYGDKYNLTTRNAGGIFNKEFEKLKVDKDKFNESDLSEIFNEKFIKVISKIGSERLGIEGDEMDATQKAYKEFKEKNPKDTQKWTRAIANKTLGVIRDVFGG